MQILIFIWNHLHDLLCIGRFLGVKIPPTLRRILGFLPTIQSSLLTCTSSSVSMETTKSHLYNIILASASSQSSVCHGYHDILASSFRLTTDRVDCSWGKPLYWKMTSNLSNAGPCSCQRSNHETPDKKIFPSKTFLSILFIVFRSARTS